MGGLSSTEQEIVERAAAEPMREQVLAWSRSTAGRATSTDWRHGRRARRRLRGSSRVSWARRSRTGRSHRRQRTDRPHRARQAFASEGAARCAGAAAVYRPHGHGVRRRPRFPGHALDRGRSAQRTGGRRHERRHCGDARGAQGDRSNRRRQARLRGRDQQRRGGRLAVLCRVAGAGCGGQACRANL